MIVYEKNNKLNISFDNEIKENPDLQIGKEDEKTEIMIDGQKNSSIPVPVLPEDVGKTIVVNEDGSYALANVGGGSGGGTKIVNITEEFNNQWSADATFSEMLSAYQSGKTILFSKGNATAIATYNAESGGESLEPTPANFTAYLFEPTGLQDVPAIAAFVVNITENDCHVDFGTIS